MAESRFIVVWKEFGTGKQHRSLQQAGSIDEARRVFQYQNAGRGVIDRVGHQLRFVARHPNKEGFWMTTLDAMDHDDAREEAYKHFTNEGHIVSIVSITVERYH